MKSYYQRIISQEMDTFSPFQPAVNIYICTTPRTAGNTLCDAMQQLAWGVPSEYFMPAFALPLYQRWVSPHCNSMLQIKENLSKYGEILLAKRSNNGIFSIKVFPTEMDVAWNTIGNVNAKNYFIYLTRENKISQTISLAVTLLTGKPFDNETVIPGIPRIEAINQSVLESIYFYIHRLEQFWAQRGKLVPPENIIEVTTENLLANPGNVMQNIAKQFSLPWNKSQDLAMLKSGAYQTETKLKQELMQTYGEFLSALNRKHQHTF